MEWGACCVAGRRVRNGRRLGLGRAILWYEEFECRFQRASGNEDKTGQVVGLRLEPAIVILTDCGRHGSPVGNSLDQAVSVQLIVQPIVSDIVSKAESIPSSVLDQRNQLLDLGAVDLLVIDSP